MKRYDKLYEEIISTNNLTKAWRNTRKRKTKKDYVKKFEKRLAQNIFRLHHELKNKIYFPIELKTFIIKDPKTRKISKSDFRDRVVHHALINILEPIYEKIFIHDSYASRKNKGTLAAIMKCEKFKMRITKNETTKAYTLKCDIKKYFENVNHTILLNIIKKKIKCNRTLWLIKQILNNYVGGGGEKKLECH